MIFNGCSSKLKTELKDEIKTESGQRVADKLINFIDIEHHNFINLFNLPNPLI